MQVKPVQGKGSCRQGELSDHSGSLIPMKRERWREKCSGVENALDDSAIVRVSGQINECPKQVLHLSREAWFCSRELGKNSGSTAAGGTLVWSSLLEEKILSMHIYIYHQDQINLESIRLNKIK